MTPERWQQIKGILAEAIECDDAIARTTFVENACIGDRLLKQEVEALLAYADTPTKIDDESHPGRIRIDRSGTNSIRTKPITSPDVSTHLRPD